MPSCTGWRAGGCGVPERACGCPRWLRIVTGVRGRVAVRRASGVLLACVGMGTAWAGGLVGAGVAGGGGAGHGDGPGCRVGRAGCRRQGGDGGSAVPGAAGARAGPGGVAGGGTARGGGARSACPAARPGLVRPVRAASVR